LRMVPIEPRDSRIDAGMGLEAAASEHLRTQKLFKLDNQYILHKMPPVASSRSSRKEKLVRRVSIALSFGLLALTALMLVAQHHR